MTSQHSPDLFTTPATTHSLKGQLSLDPSQTQKRKHTCSSDPGANQRPLKQRCQPRLDPISHWIEYKEWPRAYLQDKSTLKMPPKRAADSSSPQSTALQKSPQSAVLQKILDDARIYVDDCITELEKDDQELVQSLSRKTPDKDDTVGYPGVPSGWHKWITLRAQNRNEAFVQTYLTPLVVPSPVVLHMIGFRGMEGLDEEYNADWTHCQSLIPRRPRPDYVIGLSDGAFHENEVKKIRQYASKSDSPFVTKNICFPFLICEVKASSQGLVNGERQALHSAAIAVRSLFLLYESAYGKASAEMQNDLVGRLLVFSVLHDSRHIDLFGHYATGTDDSTRKYYRYHLTTTSLTGALDQIDANNFVRNLYTKFVPLHIKRIKDALEMLPPPQSVPSQQENSETDSETLSEDESPSKRARVRPAEQAQLKRQNSQLMDDLVKQRKATEQQAEQHKEDLKQQKEEMQQRVNELKADKEKLEREMEQRVEKLEREMQQRAEEQKAEKEGFQEILLATVRSLSGQANTWDAQQDAKD